MTRKVECPPDTSCNIRRGVGFGVLGEQSPHAQTGFRSPLRIGVDLRIKGVTIILHPLSVIVSDIRGLLEETRRRVHRNRCVNPNQLSPSKCSLQLHGACHAKNDFFMGLAENRIRYRTLSTFEATVWTRFQELTIECLCSYVESVERDT